MIIVKILGILRLFCEYSILQDIFFGGNYEGTIGRALAALGICHNLVWGNNIAFFVRMAWRGGVDRTVFGCK